MTKDDEVMPGWPLSPRLIHDGEPKNPIPWPDPTPEMLASPEFEAVWQCIKKWDINVPDAYAGYCGANGNHVRAILDALEHVKASEKPKQFFTDPLSGSQIEC